MSHDRGCSTCGEESGGHAAWCQRSLARQGHDESPRGIRATLAPLVITDAGDPPHPVHGRPEYGGFDNLECAGELQAVYDKWARRAAETGTRPMRSPGHEHAIHMVLMKISRIATGQRRDDNYVDAKVYMGLAEQIKP